MTAYYYPAMGPLPYESAAAIFLKASHINYVEVKRMSEALANSAKGSFSMLGFYEEEKIQKLQRFLPLLSTNFPLNFAPIDRLKNARQKLSFCPYCIKFGYHSVFNVLKYHSVCPIHKCVLQDCCLECRRDYQKGFVAADPLPKIQAVCKACGFRTIGVVQEIKMRNKPAIDHAVLHFGELEAAWYMGVMRLFKQHIPDAQDYWRSEEHRESVTAPLEQILQLSSPERIAGVLRGYQKVYWVRHPGYKPSRDGFHFTVRNETLISGLDRLLAKYLTRHQSCLVRVKKIVDLSEPYLPCHEFCPMALAFVLLCLKLRFRYWPSFSAVNLQADNEYPEFESIISGLGTSKILRELNVVFLKILGELQRMVTKRLNFRIACAERSAYSPDSDRLLHIRKTSYSFRNGCCGQQEDPIKIFRDNVTNSLMVVVDSRVSSISRPECLRL